MKYSLKAQLLILSFMMMVPAIGTAAVYCVRAGGSGDGADWSTALPALPASLERGSTYYIADGVYGGYTFDDPEEGQKYIYIKKAIESDHGTDVGWDFSYGNDVANWIMDMDDEFYMMKFLTSYYVFDGQVGGGPGSWDSGHGFKVYLKSTLPDYRGLFIYGDASNADNNPNYISISHVEMTAPNREAGAMDMAVCVYVGLGSYMPEDNTNCNHHYYGYNYIHDIAYAFNTKFIRYWTVEYNYIVRNDCQPHNSNQGTAWQIFGSADLIIRYNIFEDIYGTAVIDIKKNYYNDNSNYEIYGNVFWTTPDNQIPDGQGFGGPGCIGDAFSQDPPTEEDNETINMKVYNNTFINLGGVNVGVSFNAPVHTGNFVYNNLWYDCKEIMHSNRRDDQIGHTHNYNSYINTPWNSHMPEPSAGDVVIASGVADTFVDFANKDFSLQTDTAAGISLGASYNTDMFGNQRGADGNWDRGAIEYDLNQTVITPNPESEPDSQSESEPETEIGPEPEDNAGNIIPDKTLLRISNNIIKAGGNSSVNIDCDVKDAGKLTVKIYDSKGREIITLWNKHEEPGIVPITWYSQDSGGSKVGSGVYLVHMECGGYKETKKIAIIR